jgi:hypothetical protein
VDWRTFIYSALIIIPPLFILVEWRVEKHKSLIKAVFLIIWIITGIFSTVQYFSDNTTMSQQIDTIDSLNVIAKNSETKLDSIHKAIISLDKMKFSDLSLAEAMALLGQEYVELKKEITEVEKKTEYLKDRDRFVPLSQSKTEQFIKSYENFSDEFKKTFQIVLFNKKNNYNTTEFVYELQRLLKHAGFNNVKNEWGTNHVSGKVTGTIVCYCDIQYVDLTKQFLNILGQNLINFKTRNIFQIKPQKNRGKNIELDIRDDPYFDKNGVISYE